MKNRSGIVQDVQHSTHSASTTAVLCPRTPRPVSAEARYTFASAVADCPVHRAQHEAFEAQRAVDDAAIDRMNRRLLRQLDLPFSRAARVVSA